MNDAVWSDEQITVDGKKISTRAFFLRDGTPVVSGSLKYSPATGLAPELWVSRSQVRGRRLAYAIPVNPRRDCPEQWNTRHPISYPLIFEKRELSDGSSVAVSFVNDLIEVRLDATRAETTKLGVPYWTRVFVNRRYLNGIPHKVIQVEMIPGVDLIRASEMRLEEERMLGPTGVWHHAKIFGLSGKNPEQDGEKALYISPAEVKDCFELISLISGMEVTVDSSLEELKKAYRKGAQKLNEGKIAAAFSQGVPFVTKKRNEIRRRELNKAYEKAIDVREGLLMHQIGEYVENAIRGGRVSESDLHAQVKVLLKDIRNLSELVFDPSIQLDGVDRAEALTIVADAPG